MHLQEGRLESGQDDSLFNPKQHVIASTARIVAQVMIKRHPRYRLRAQKLDDFIRPIATNPAGRGRRSSSKNTFNISKEYHKTRQIAISFDALLAPRL